MSYFLDEKTIKQSFDKLNSIKYGSANELYSFLLLKASGFGKFDYIDLSKEEVKKKIFDSAMIFFGTGKRHSIFISISLSQRIFAAINHKASHRYKRTVSFITYSKVSNAYCTVGNIYTSQAAAPQKCKIIYFIKIF